jgi:hypothetical protein
MLSRSPRDAVRAGSIAVASLSLGSGTVSAGAIIQLVWQNYTWFFLYLLLALLMILSAVVQVRRMLKAVP